MFKSDMHVMEARRMISAGVNVDAAVNQVCLRHRLSWLDRSFLANEVTPADTTAESKVADKPEPHPLVWLPHYTPAQIAAARCPFKDN